MSGPGSRDSLEAAGLTITSEMEGRIFNFYENDDPFANFGVHLGTARTWENGVEFLSEFPDYVLAAITGPYVTGYRYGKFVMDAHGANNNLAAFQAGMATVTKGIDPVTGGLTAYIQTDESLIALKTFGLDENGELTGTTEFLEMSRDANGIPHINGVSLVRGAVPSSGSLQIQDIIFDVSGNITSINISYHGLADISFSDPLAAAEYIIGPDGSITGGFTKINGVALGIDVQAMLDDLNFGPGGIANDAVVSAMEDLGSSANLIDQFNNWALQNGDPSLLVINTDVDTANWSATLASADGSGSKTLTSVVDASGQVTDFELVFVDGFPVTIDGGLEGELREFEITRQFKLQKDAAGNWVQEAIAEEYRFNNLIITAGTVGSMFGSSLSNLIETDNALENIAVSTVFGLVGKELFQFTAAAIDGKSVGESLDAAFDDLGLDLKNAGVGAISSFLTAELFNALSIDGVAGEVANTVGGATIGAIVENFASIADGTYSISDVVNGTEGLQGIQFGSVIGSYLGYKLASQIISFDTLGGQIGASAGAGAGSFFAGKAIGELIGKLGGLGGPLGFAIGAFLGYIVGGLLGSLFGGTPRSGADVLYNPKTGEFGVSNVWSKKGGSKDGAEQLASIAAANLNGILTAIGGSVINEGRLSGGTYGTRKSDYTYRVDGGSFGPGDPGKNTIAKIFDGDNPEATTLLIEHGVLNALDDLQIAGGDVFLKRALYGSLDTLMAGDNVKA